MKATIQNISNTGESVNVFVSFSNGQEKVYYLNVDQATKVSIREQIKVDLAEFKKQEKERQDREERAIKVVQLLSELQGKVIE